MVSVLGVRGRKKTCMVGRWVGGWVGWVEENEAVRMSCCGAIGGCGGWVCVGGRGERRGRWVGGWVV